MGTSTMYSYKCACRKTRLLEPEEDIWIEWEKCAEHYDPDVDDKMILEAAENKRKYEQESK